MLYTYSASSSIEPEEIYTHTNCCLLDLTSYFAKLKQPKASALCTETTEYQVPFVSITTIPLNSSCDLNPRAPSYRVFVSNFWDGIY